MEIISNEIWVPEADGKSERFRELLVLNIDRVRGAKEDQIVRRREKVDTAYHVLAHTRIVVLVDKLCNLADDFHFLKQIHRVWFGIMTQEEGRALLG